MSVIAAPVRLELCVIGAVLPKNSTSGFAPGPKEAKK
jgi:hypothetical protein